MLAIDEHATLEEASQELLSFALEPDNWVALERLKHEPGGRPGENAAYQRTVGALRICVSVDVTSTLEVFLRVAFRAPGLTPMKAADHLATFLGERLPLRPNTEWHVREDSKSWIHFIRRYAGEPLRA
jgi:hypothetical protein